MHFFCPAARGTGLRILVPFDAILFSLMPQTQPCFSEQRDKNGHELGDSDIETATGADFAPFLFRPLTPEPDSITKKQQPLFSSGVTPNIVVASFLLKSLQRRVSFHWRGGQLLLPTLSCCLHAESMWHLSFQARPLTDRVRHPPWPIQFNKACRPLPQEGGNPKRKSSPGPIHANTTTTADSDTLTDASSASLRSRLNLCRQWQQQHLTTLGRPDSAGHLLPLPD